MGAWIEIFPGGTKYNAYYVAPFMGAWIEMYFCRPGPVVALVSHPSWVRGLK